jgi:hypothetical protein
MAIGIGILFCILSCLLLWVIIGGRGHWLVKLALILPTVWFSLAISNTLPTMLGWPSEDEIPAKFEVFWIKVTNPSLTKGAEGSILVWLEDLGKQGDEYDSIWSLYRPGNDEPRVHRLPYSEQLHKQANQALDLIKKGKRVAGERGNLKGDGDGKGGKGKGKGRKGNGRRGPGGNGESDDSVGPKFYVMPPVKMVPKTGNQE